jgi:hypothetical protein
MTVPAANEGGVVVILAIGPQANARAGPEDRNLVEKVVMVLHRSEISDAAPTGRQAFHPGSHEIKSLSIFGWQIAPQCGMIPQSPGTWLSLMLWVQTFLISSDDRRVSGFLLFHLRLRYHSTDPQHYQLQSSKNGEAEDANMCCNSSLLKLLGTSYYPLLARVPRSEFGIQHSFAQRQMQR